MARLLSVAVRILSQCNGLAFLHRYKGFYRRQPCRQPRSFCDLQINQSIKINQSMIQSIFDTFLYIIIYVSVFEEAPSTLRDDLGYVTVLY